MAFNNKQFPTVSQMVSIFNQMDAQKLAAKSQRERTELERADLNRQRKRDRSLSSEASARIKVSNENLRHNREKDLRAQQQLAIENERATETARIATAREERGATMDLFNMANDDVTLEMAQEKHKAAQEQRERMNMRADDALKVSAKKDQRAQAMDLFTLGKGIDDITLDDLKPGETEDAESFATRYQRKHANYMLSGATATEAAILLRGEKPLSKPEETLTRGAKVNALLQLGGAAPEGVAKALGEELDLTIDPEMLRKTKDYNDSQKGAVGLVFEALSTDRIPGELSAELYDLIDKNNISKFFSTFEQSKKRYRTTSAEFGFILDHAEDTQNTEMHAKTMAQVLTRNSIDELGDSAIVYKGVLDNRGWIGSEKWIPIPYSKAKALFENNRIKVEDLRQFPSYWTDPDYSDDTTTPPKTEVPETEFQGELLQSLKKSFDSPSSKKSITTDSGTVIKLE